MNKTKTTDSFVKEYEQKRPRYVEFCNRIKALLESLLQNENMRVHAVEARAKTVDGFRDKITRPGKSYDEPLNDMPDLVGMRVILYQPKEVQRAVQIVQDEFDVDADQSSDTLERLATNEFGYRSIHLVCRLNDVRKSLAEWENFATFQVEFQIRTVLQHAWAAMSHALQYKKEAAVPDKIKRRLFRLSGLLELADEEFSNLRELHDQLVTQVSTSTDDEMSEFSINKITLSAFVDRSAIVSSAYEAALKVGFSPSSEVDNEMDYPPEKEFSDLATLCELVGIETLSEVSKAIKMPARTRNKYLKDLFEADGGEVWYASPGFVVVLLIIRFSHKKLTPKMLVENGWGLSTAEKVLDVAKSNTRPPKRQSKKRKKAT